jgi:hypothetical protein
MQKLLKIRAALSDSLSSGVGQNVSAPSLFESLFMGGPTFSNQDLVAALVLSHTETLDGSVTFADESMMNCSDLFKQE